ncbi:maleylpyruvate isomerase family mycothiol-dependent enzyme [Nonomuraea rhodomycinica]|nr:maleylpyruvate isomerase family mycothiol-dependent enzyme [Nonomuraea rhodomycinica]
MFGRRSAVEDMAGQAARSGARFLRTADALGDAGLRGPSGLATWTRGHVLAHVARSADAYVWMLRLARTGAEPGPRADAAAMARAVEEGAALPAAELLAGTRRSLDRFAEEVRTMPGPAWDTMVTALAGWRHPAWYVLCRCVRELETHHVDLAAGYRTADWPEAYVAWALEETLAALAARGFPLSRVTAADHDRTWEVSPDGPAVTAPGHVLLGWLSGRTPAARITGDGPSGTLPVPPPWPQPPVPGWGPESG